MMATRALKALGQLWSIASCAAQTKSALSIEVGRPSGMEPVEGDAGLVVFVATGGKNSARDAVGKLAGRADDIPSGSRRCCTASCSTGWRNREKPIGRWTWSSVEKITTNWRGGDADSPGTGKNRQGTQNAAPSGKALWTRVAQGSTGP